VLEVDPADHAGWRIAAGGAVARLLGTSPPGLASGTPR
jgi:hypothetical protein